MGIATVTTLSDLLRDVYPMPGQRIKQWIVDRRREAAWERDTCPRVDVSEHDDNTGLGCRNVGNVPWSYLDHDCCLICNERMDAERERDDVKAWLAEKGNRPPIEPDHDKFSDEIEPEPPPIEWPMRMRK